MTSDPGLEAMVSHLSTEYCAAVKHGEDAGAEERPETMNVLAQQIETAKRTDRVQSREWRAKSSNRRHLKREIHSVEMIGSKFRRAKGWSRAAIKSFNILRSSSSNPALPSPRYRIHLFDIQAP